MDTEFHYNNENSTWNPKFWWGEPVRHLFIHKLATVLTATRCGKRQEGLRLSQLISCGTLSRLFTLPAQRIVVILILPQAWAPRNDDRIFAYVLCSVEGIHIAFFPGLIN